MGWTDLHTGLQDRLAELYLDKADGKRIAEQAGMDLRFMTLSDNAANNWHEIVKKAQADELLMKNLTKQVQREHPNDEKLNKIIEELDNKKNGNGHIPGFIERLYRVFTNIPGRIKFLCMAVGVLSIVVAAWYGIKGINKNGQIDYSGPDPPGMNCDESGEVCWNRFNMEFQLIPTGSLNRGDQDDQKSGKTPADAQITQPFYIQRTEVTQAQWKRVMGLKLNPSKYSDCEGCPVEMVSRNKAQEFIAKLNQLEKTHRYRLPTESEWEYACKAGSESELPFRKDKKLLPDYAWYDNEETGNKTHTAAQKKPNAWQLFDMLGNVWEWVEDDWHATYEGAPNDGGAWIYANRSEWGVLRGGSFYDNQALINCTYRHKNKAFETLDNVGFRCVWTKSNAIRP